MKLFDSFPPRFLVPNGVTCLSMVLGFASIRASFLAGASGDAAGFATAAWFVMYAVLLDKADGFLARRLRATSLIGVQLDSFSDFVTFGLAPAALFDRALPLLAPATFGQGPGAIVRVVVVAAYALAAAIRLAKFNVTTADDPRFFRGLPSTSSGGLLASAYLAHRELGLGAGAAVVLLAWMVVNTVLMVSNLPMPKLAPSKHLAMKALQIFVVGSAYVLIPLRLFPVYLVTVATIVSIIGFVVGVTQKRREARDGGDDEHGDMGAPALSK